MDFSTAVRGIYTLYLFWVLVCQWLGVNCVNFFALKQDASYDLANDLAADYRADMLPVCLDAQLPVKSRIELLPINIIAVEEKAQIIRMNTWNRWYWMDCRLRWEPGDYNDTREIIISSQYVWIPDITLLYDSATSVDFGEVLRHKEVKINYKGMVSLYFPYIHISTCTFNVIPFPNDFQLCQFHFGSWSFNGFELDVDIISNTTDTSEYIESNEWRMLNFSVNRNVSHYSCCPESYPIVIFQIELMRYPLHYHLNLILPCCLIHLVSIFMLVIPYDSGERISFGITCVLSMAVFSLTMADILPATSEAVPKISLYFSFVLIHVSCSTIINIVMVSLQQRTKTYVKVPVCVRHFFLTLLGTVLCVGPSCTSTCRSKTVDITPNGATSLDEIHSSNLQDWMRFFRVIDRLLTLFGVVVYIVLTYAIYEDPSLLI